MSDNRQYLLYPANAPADYATARDALAVEEAALLEHVERVAAQRRTLPMGAEMPDYAFTEATFGRDGKWEGSQPISLYDLVPDNRPLLVYHMMLAPGDGDSCSMCASWVDAFNGVAVHVRQHALIAVCAKAPIDELISWANRRGWYNLPFISTFGTSFNLDTNTENGDGSQNESTSVFVRDAAGKVRHWYTSKAAIPNWGDERGMDQFNSLWNLLDILPAGRGNWHAGNDYALAEVTARS